MTSSAAAAPPALRIVSARTLVVGTPWRELAFLELATDAGLVGVSEVRMVNKTDTFLARLEELVPRYVIGTDPFDGCFAAPDRPGLGVRLDHGACARHPRTGGHIKLFEQGWERRGFGGS